MAKNQSNKERLKEITAGIEKGIQELFQSDRYRNYLSTMSKFHRYSLNNVMLIHSQMPDATLVAGRKKWQTQFQRKVLDSERSHGIEIIAPASFNKTIQTEKLDPDTQLPILGKDGKPVMVEKTIKIPYFKMVKVYDVSQTDGKPLPKLSMNLTGDVAQYEVFLEALKRTSPVPIDIKPIAEDMDGYLNLETQRIAIQEGMSQVQTISAGVHEIAHAKLHNYTAPSFTSNEPYAAAEIFDKPALFSSARISSEDIPKGLFRYELRGSDDDPDKPVCVEASVVVNHAGTIITGEPLPIPENGRLFFQDDDDFCFTSSEMTMQEFWNANVVDKGTEEVQAESISYAVCQYFGIETGDNSFGYIASWSQGKELEELKASLTIINKTASELITSIEQHFQEICKERGISIAPAEQAQEAAPEVIPEVDEVTFFAKELATYLVEGSKGRKLPEVPFTDVEGITGWVEEHLRNHELRPLSDAMLDVIVISGQDARFDDLSDRLANMNQNGILQKEAVPEPSQKPDYSLISNFQNMGDGESTYVQKYIPSTDSRMIPADIMYLGTYKKCLKIQEKLKNGTMTEQQAKALDDSEKMYIVEDKTYLHIQRTDDGFDYSIYDKNSAKLLDGGQLDNPDRYIFTACTEICDLYGFDAYSVKYAPLELAESLQEAQYKPNQAELHNRLADHFSQQDAALWDAAPEQEITTPQPDPYLTQQDLVSFGYTAPDMLPISTDFALELMERDVPVYMLKADNTEEMAFDSEDLAMHVSMFGVTTQDWNEVREQPDILAIQRRFAVSYDRELVAKQEPPAVNHLKNTEMSMEDDYGMIDGIINNGKAPGKEDFKEKKPSVMEKLKSSQPRQPRRNPNRKRRRKRSFEYDPTHDPLRTAAYGHLQRWDPPGADPGIERYAYLPGR